MRDEPADDAFVEAVRAGLRRAVFDEDAHDGIRTSIGDVELREDGEWPELEVAWAVKRPGLDRLAPVPRRGTVRVPVGREWLRAGYLEDTEAYVAEVVWRVQSASRAAGRSRWSSRRKVRALTPDVVAEHWRGLTAELASWGSVTETSPGRLQVVPDNDDGDEATPITVVVPPEAWATLVERGVVELDQDPAIGTQARDDDEVFLVLHEDRLVPSTREDLPPVRGTSLARRIAALRAENPDAEFGWYAEDPGSSRDS